MIRWAVRTYLRLRGEQVDYPARPREPVTSHKIAVEHRPTADQHFVRVHVTSENWDPKRRGHVWTPHWEVWTTAKCLHTSTRNGYEEVYLADGEYPYPSRAAADRAVGMYAESCGLGSTLEPALAFHSVGSRPPARGLMPSE